jgi:hypothetical protein
MREKGAQALGDSDSCPSCHALCHANTLPHESLSESHPRDCPRESPTVEPPRFPPRILPACDGLCECRFQLSPTGKSCRDGLLQHFSMTGDDLGGLGWIPEHKTTTVAPMESKPYRQSLAPSPTYGYALLRVRVPSSTPTNIWLLDQSFGPQSDESPGFYAQLVDDLSHAGRITRERDRSIMFVD